VRRRAPWRLPQSALPNYEVFDEARNFAPGSEPGAVWRIGGAVAGVCVCEDLWSGDGPPEAQAAAGAQILLVPNASPFHREKPDGRRALAASVARRTGLPVVYVNCVGGQDELVFDGGSLVVDSDGEVRYRAEQFRSSRFSLDVVTAPPRLVAGSAVRTVHSRAGADRAPEAPPPSAALDDNTGQVWEALVLGTRHFVHRNGSGSAVLGLSGGIDSAVTAAVAADALGPEKVLGLFMPAPGSTEGDREDARAVADGLGIGFDALPMETVMAALGALLPPVLAGRPSSGTRLDLLARMRGAVLLAVSDELGHIALATGNKTELSIGSAALFGDMAGQFAPLKDCPKTLLYALAERRNRRSPAIPRRVLERTPSALLGEDNALPPYAELDSIVERYVEKGEGLEEIVAAGYEPAIVRGVLQLIDDAELKRRQTPPGVKITARAFGKDRQMPITNAWRPFAAESSELVGEEPEAAATAPHPEPAPVPGTGHAPPTPHPRP